MKSNVNKFSREYLFKECILSCHCILLRLHKAIPWNNNVIDEIFMVDMCLSEKEKEELFLNITNAINTYGVIKTKAFAEQESPYDAREVFISTNNIREIEKINN